jgi:hypothetical protein
MLNVETDFEQLEQYLDGVLDGAGLVELQSRLTTDADLSAVLTELKSQRAVRAAVWQSMEGDADSASRLMWRVRGAILQQQKQTAVAQPTRIWSRWRIASVGSAAAACLLVGFFFGRIGGDHNSTATLPSATPAIAKLNPPAPFEDEVHPAVDPAPRETVVLNSATPTMVPITNEYGKVVAYQKFDTPDEARHFAEDLHRARPDNSAPAAPGPSKLATEEQVPF